MNSLELQLKELVKLLSAARINYALLGGIAVSLYGEPRLTADIDVNILLDKEKIEDFLKKAEKYGFYPLPANIKKFIKQTGVIPMKFSKGEIVGRCDFIIAENEIEYSGINRARLKKINSIKVKIVSPEDLLIHKLTSDRPKDIEDARGILIRQGRNLDIKYVSHWLRIIAKANHKPELLELFESFKSLLV